MRTLRLQATKTCKATIKASLLAWPTGAAVKLAWWKLKQNGYLSQGWKRGLDVRTAVPEGVNVLQALKVVKPVASWIVLWLFPDLHFT